MRPDTQNDTTAGERRDVELASTVVRYSDSPDRCTVYPPEAEGDTRMSTWLTVDRAACVDLETVR